MTVQLPTGPASFHVHAAEAPRPVAMPALPTGTGVTAPQPAFSFLPGDPLAQASRSLPVPPVLYPSAKAPALAPKGASQPAEGSAQTTKEQELTGNYKALDFWAKLKLGSAYYVNPQAVRETTVVYSYAPETFAATGKSPALWVLAHDGKVTFGIPDNPTNTIKAVPINVLSGRYKVDSPADLQLLLASGNVSVITDKESLFGSAATQALVRNPEGQEPYVDK